VRAQVERLELALERMDLEGETALCTHGIGFDRIVWAPDPEAWSGGIPYSSSGMPCVPRMR